MQRYWTFQVLGWLAYSAVGITINLIGGVQLLPLLCGHALLILASIGLTHTFRSFIRRRRQASGETGPMWPFLAAGVAVISLVQTSVVIGTNLVLSGGEWSVIAIVALWWGMFLASGVWTILYVRFTERRGYAVREVQLQLALKEAELRALEAQLNPHFLFNCLNSIRALVPLDPPRAQDMMTRLSNVLRNSLRHDRQHAVQLALELEVIADYLALEAIRFEERLRSQIVVDSEAVQCLVPPMLLQTLVENAIKHGVSQATGGGQLTICACLQNGFVRLVVTNTGSLIGSPRSQSQLGLANARERLSLLYGDSASLILDDGDGVVNATVLIPAS
jgi:anti-sigma regulatory factor (Ser/Thr protein kinase)